MKERGKKEKSFLIKKIVKIYENENENQGVIEEQ